MIPKSLSDRIIHFHYCSGGNSRFLHACRKIDKSLYMFYEESEKSLKQFYSGLSKSNKAVFHQLQTHRYEEIQEKLYLSGIRTVSCADQNYPSQLYHMSIPPAVLYCRGTMELPSLRTSLGVVGTRYPSPRAQLHIDTLLRPLVERNIAVISGMALGVDSQAHRTALKYEGRTTAVLAYGLQHIYPQSNKMLKEYMEKEQLVITEYPPYVKPMKHRFPERNRIISGLSRGVFVVEAKKRSGSLITAETALEQGRDVYALPGRINDLLSEGTNRLIQDGAKAVLSAQDLLEEYTD